MATTQAITDSRRTRGDESGVALLMALMALLILTVLGLTLAATTSTELQVAANYRWSQQALYNAEAGLEAAKVELVSTWGNLPDPRLAPWDPAGPTGTVSIPGFSGGRNFEMGACDSRGGGMGYGVILNGLENQTQYQGQPLNGAFTVWVRWPLDYNPDGTVSEASSRDALIVVAEGVAPFAVNQGSVSRANQVLEATFYSGQGNADRRCKTRMEASGGSPGGSGMNVCHSLGVRSGDAPPPGIPGISTP